MKAESRLAQRAVETMLERDPFSRWLGLTVDAVSAGEAVVSMVVREEMLNGFGVCHGGVVFSLADSALAFAANTLGRVSVSVEISASFFEKVRCGDRLVARATQRRDGRRLGHYDVDVCREDSVVVASFRGIVYRTDKSFEMEDEDE